MFFYSNDKDGVRRWNWFRTGKNWQGEHFPFALSVETAWRKQVAPGFYIKIGNDASEYPFKTMLSVYFFAIFTSLSFKPLDKVLLWIGNGHKRKVGLNFHDGMAWWNVWYDDDGGWDEYHKCEAKHRGKSYRGWACLREGNIHLNPLDFFWGGRYYSYTDIEERTKKVRFSDVPADDRTVTFTLQEMRRSRRRGPKWVRHEEFVGHIVEWNCVEGIPVENQTWKGRIYSAAFAIAFSPNWHLEAVVKLKDYIQAEREKNGYLHDGHDARKR